MILINGNKYSVKKRFKQVQLFFILIVFILFRFSGELFRPQTSRISFLHHWVIMCFYLKKEMDIKQPFMPAAFIVILYLNGITVCTIFLTCTFICFIIVWGNELLAESWYESCLLFCEVNVFVCMVLVQINTFIKWKISTFIPITTEEFLAPSLCLCLFCEPSCVFIRKCFPSPRGFIRKAILFSTWWEHCRVTVFFTTTTRRKARS